MTPRERLEAAVDRAIDLLNRLDGDCDTEPETDLGALEDEITPGMYCGRHDGRGCAVFDGGGAADGFAGQAEDPRLGCGPFRGRAQR